MAKHLTMLTMCCIFAKVAIAKLVFTVSRRGLKISKKLVEKQSKSESVFL